jgi:sugar lactone lactonase YvrE
VSITARLFVDCRSPLGEGPFWHHLRGEIFWFDILGKTLYAAKPDGSRAGKWVFGTMASAAGIIDATHLAIAAEKEIFSLDLATGKTTTLVPLEADIAGNRSNDGRVNRAGGLWIGTMAQDEVPYSGSVYQYRHGSLKKLFGDIRIPNATCFSPDGRIVYFTDTPNKIIMQRELDPASGEPKGYWRVFADTANDPGAPDGAVTDAEGFVWCARWGGSRVIRYTPDGRIDREVMLPVSQVTCPAFGGPDLKTLYITSAAKNLTPEQLAREPHAGSLFAADVGVAGLPETLLQA